MVLHIVFAFMATLSFAVIFNSPKKELLLCGFVGALSWFLYEMAFTVYETNTIPTLAGAVGATVVSRLLSFRRKNPLTVYLISGIIPLVPGSGIYYTAYNLLINESALAYSYGIDTLKVAGVISIGIMAVLSLPYKLFVWP